MLLPLVAALSFAQSEPIESDPPEDRYPELQVAVHGGLLQPLLARGFNAAVDVRHHRLVLSYSHGEGLDLTSVSSFTQAQREAGARVRMPSTTGFGVGATLVDELYVMADFKLHDFEISYQADTERYRTLTVGAEVGYRLFVTRGLFVTPVIRFWPNVYESRSSVSVGGVEHAAMDQGVGGLFANVLVGGSFDVRGKRKTGTSRVVRRD